jgi:hypothetical protein
MTRYPKGTTVVYNGIDAVVLCEYPESVYIRMPGDPKDPNNVKNVSYDAIKTKKQIMKEALKPFIDRVYDGAHQITIDLIQNEVEELIQNESVESDDIGSVIYRIENVIEVMKPELEDLPILTGINIVLTAWQKQIEFGTNIVAV